MIQWFAAKGGFAYAEVIFREWWKLALGLILGGLLVFPMAQCSGAQNARARIEASQAKADAKAEAKASAAREQAASERLSDRETVFRLEQELSHADDAAPDSAPSAARLALACERLRRSGVRKADLPAGC
jgi:hypothetical protein